MPDAGPPLPLPIADIFLSLKNFELLDYLLSLSNVLDWSHFALMLSGWLLWYAHVDRTVRFSQSMASAYPILASPADQTPARILLTNPDEEGRFLCFSRSLDELEQGLRQYTNVTSICGVAIVPLLPRVPGVFSVTCPLYVLSVSACPDFMLLRVTPPGLWARSRASDPLRPAHPQGSGLPAPHGPGDAHHQLRFHGPAALLCALRHHFCGVLRRRVPALRAPVPVLLEPRPLGAVSLPRAAFVRPDAVLGSGDVCCRRNTTTCLLQCLLRMKRR